MNLINPITRGAEVGHCVQDVKCCSQQMRRPWYIWSPPSMQHTHVRKTRLSDVWKGDTHPLPHSFQVKGFQVDYHSRTVSPAGVPKAQLNTKPTTKTPKQTFSIPVFQTNVWGEIEFSEMKSSCKLKPKDNKIQRIEVQKSKFLTLVRHKWKPLIADSVASLLEGSSDTWGSSGSFSSGSHSRSLPERDHSFRTSEVLMFNSLFMTSLILWKSSKW